MEREFRVIRNLFDCIRWNINCCKVILSFPPETVSLQLSVSQLLCGHLSAWRTSFEIQSYKWSRFLTPLSLFPLTHVVVRVHVSTMCAGLYVCVFVAVCADCVELLAGSLELLLLGACKLVPVWQTLTEQTREGRGEGPTCSRRLITVCWLSQILPLFLSAGTFSTGVWKCIQSYLRSHIFLPYIRSQCTVDCYVSMIFFLSNTFNKQRIVNIAYLV